MIQRLLEKLCTKAIIKDQKTNKIYMIRYILLKTKYLSIFFHRFMNSDGDIPHDHPFNFYTYVISKGYREVRYLPNPNNGVLHPFVVERKKGSLAFRRAEDIHQVVVDRTYEIKEIEEAPLTMCVMLRRRRIWGFIERSDTGYTWTNWKDYLGITPDDPRYFGSE